MSFVGEIRRRKVFQVAAVYAVVAWLLIQIVDVISEPLGLPDWFVTFAIVLFGIGFPIALILAWAFDLTPEGIESESAPHASDRASRQPDQRLTLSIQTVVLLAVAFLVVDQFLLEPRSPLDGSASSSASVRPINGVRRFEIDLGETFPLGNTGLHAEIALSRDGENLAYVISPEFVGENSLFLRSLDRLNAARMSTGRRPFFSDDGQRLGLQGGVAGTLPQPGAMGMGMGMGGNLRTFSLNGGPPQVHTVGETGRRFGGSWHDDTIVWSQGSAGVVWSGSLYRLSTTSNEIELLLAPEPGKALVAPEFLPSGDAVLFTIRDVDGNARVGSVAVLSLETGEYHELIEDAYDARYAPTGHLVFARSGALWAAAFDPETLEVSGAQTPIIDGVQMDGNYGDASYAFSDDGLLVYVEGSDVGVFSGTDSSLPLRSLAMLELDGSLQNLPMQPRAIENMAISPDGERVALVIDDAPDEDIYILDDFARAVPRRLTFDQGEDIWPLWTPDGERIVFWSSREGGGLFSKAANGTGLAERLTESAEMQRPESFTPDGSELIFVDGATREGVTPNGTLFRIPLSGEGVAEPLLGTGAPEPWADFSPDGRWLAYSAGEWGQIEVYVEPYPNPSGSKWQVSTGGFALLPQWLSDDALFYFDWDAGIPMGVTMETEPVFQPGEPAELWRDAREQNGITARAAVVDFLPDARGFLAAMNITDSTDTDATTEDSTSAKQTRLIVVENWFEELKALVSPPN